MLTKICLLLFCVTISLTTARSPCFRAGVYEHYLIGRGQPINASNPLQNVIKNLAAYERVAEEAARQNVELLLFPEEGIFEAATSTASTDSVRFSTRPLCEEVPPVTAGSTPIVPCRSDNFKGRPILRSLSCMARKHKFYVVANMCDIQKCTNGDTTCRDDGVRMYNTLVAFGPSGDLLGVYHKHHLFGETHYDLPPQEFVTFDTPFGRMGLYICFDKIFRDPSVTMAEVLGVDTMLLSTWWFDEAPFLLAHQYHQGEFFEIINDFLLTASYSGWSLTNGVNMLAANMKHLKVGTTGSGIYSGADGAITYVHDSEGDWPRLLVANIASNPKKGPNQCSDSNPVSIPFKYTKTGTDYAFTQIDLDELVHVKLTKSEASLKVCDDGVCCEVDYVTESGLDQDVTHYLVVANRTRDHFFWTKYKWTEEICAIVAYDGNQRNYSRTTGVVFQKLTLTGSFSTKYVYPSVLQNRLKLLKMDEWSMDGNSTVNEYTIHVESLSNILVVGLYGRPYDRDPAYDINDYQ